MGRASCYEFMQAFPEDTELCNITVVPLVGGSPLLTREFQLIESVREFSEKLRGTPVVLYSPGFVDTIEDKNGIWEAFTCSRFWKVEDLDFAVIGVGRPRSPMSRAGTGHQSAGGNQPLSG